MRFVAVTWLLLLTLIPYMAVAGSQQDETKPSLDINSATASMLADALPGVGPAKAARIVQWREKKGSFKHIDQLLEIKGIGPKTLEKLRPLIHIGSPSAALQQRRQLVEHEDKVKADIRRVINAATYAARPASIEAIPRKAWYKKSMLEILRTH